MQQQASAGRGPGQFRRRLDNPDLVALLDHWCALRRDSLGKVPPRRALDPMNIRALLPNVELYRRMPDGRLRCCLSGTAVRYETGRESTGLHLDELLPPSALPSRAALFDQALDTGKPVAYRCGLPVPSHDYKATIRVLLPMADQDGRSAIVLSMVIFTLKPLLLVVPDADPSMTPYAFAADEADLTCGSDPMPAAA